MSLKIASGMLTPLIVATALFMENMDATVIATSLPDIAQDLSVNPLSLKLALTSYLVSLAVFIPISGWVADKFGARTIFCSAIIVFVIGSLLCAASESLEWFVVSRFIQGMGGAMMVPVGRLVILKTVNKAELVKALSYLTIPALLGPVIGPPLGGLISTYFHWRWIFLINVPIGILGLILAKKHIVNLKEDQVPPLDWLGFALIGIGLSLLMLGLATEGKHMLSAEVSIGLVLLGALLLLLYVMHYHRCQHPLLNLSLLRTKTFHASVVGGFAFRVGVGAIPFLLPLMLQLGFGFSAFASGLLTCATAIGALFMKTIVVHILQRFGFRRVLIVNSILVGISIGVYALFTASTPHVLMLAILLAGGCLRSLQFTGLNAIAFADIKPADMSQATSLSSVAQQLAAGVGVTLGALVVQVVGAMQGHLQVVASDFAWAFVFMAVITILSSVIFMRLDNQAGAQLTKG
ncbi:DHA2 family efflux MFS transporter permease subunit [Neisseriaceae bacterium TC5R-5]|nr:DHA2 family efflux MFS transporter permease subunit [Neisseriaceae bacterium TC5R-5]